MAKTKILNVEEAAIALINHNEDDYISLTDICRKFPKGGKFIENWIRNKKTIEFLSVWETIYNPSFKPMKIEGFSDEPESKEIMSAKKWISDTGSIGLVSKSGRYGGTYAQKDIALEFCMWISPEFKYLLIKEFQRLKNQEAIDAPWKIKRHIAATNYRLQTDAIKENIIPYIEDVNESMVYADEADILNVAILGYTAKQWRLKNPDLVAKGDNLRDHADITQLIVFANMESFNSILISRSIPVEQRIHQINEESKRQLIGLYKRKIDFNK